MKSIFSLILWFFGLSICASQELPTIIPVSPEASSLGKYIEIPAATYTGIPQISVPIWELNQKGIKIPINLSYHAGGIKVNEIASWVGTGWSLNFGGAVFRSTRGIPDDIEGGYLRTTGDRKIKSFYNASPERREALLQLASNGELDFESDIFQFNILGYSGKFVFDQETKDIVFFSKDDIKILPIYKDPTNLNEIIEWEITLPNGILCYFGAGKAYDFSLLNQSFSDKGGRGGLNTTSSHKTAWYISSIIDTNGNVIEFSYDQYEKDVCTLGGQQDSFGIATENAPCLFPITNFSKVTSYSNSVVQYAKIKEINSVNTKIIFVPETTNREDFENDKALHKIEIYDKQSNNLITSYTFKYYYSFNPEGSRLYPLPCINPTDPNEIGKRLFLSDVQQQKGVHKIPPYQFIYNSIKLPARTSFSQDYWGYYNGAENSTLIPEVYVKNVWASGSGSIDYLTLNGANRKVDVAKSKAGILNKIIYPTGGSASYFYENNVANNASRFNLNDYQQPDLQTDILATLSTNEIDLNDLDTWIIDKKFIVEQNTCNPSDDFPTVYIKSNYTCIDRDNCLYIIKIDGMALPTDSPEATCMQLSPGEHTLSIELYRPPEIGAQIPYGFAEVLKSKINIDEIRSITVGSQRVKQIVLKDDITGSIIKNYEYLDGEVLNLPVYTNLRTASYLCHFGNPQVPYAEIVPVYTRKSNSFTSLSSIGGGYVGYKKVSEFILDKNIAGTTEYLFSFYDDGISRSFPFRPATSLDWRRGNLLEKKYYKHSGDQKTLIREEKNTYSYYNRTILNSLYVFNPHYGNTLDITAFKLDYETYPTMGETVKMIASESKEYFPEILSNSTKYFYDGINHLQTTKTETTDSNGAVLISTTKYPQDLQTKTVAEQKLIDQHRIATPIQIISLKKEGTNPETQLSKVYNQYRDWGNNRIFQDTIKTAKSSNDLQPRIIYHKYDNYGNPLEVSKADGMHISYIWGYNRQHPVAKVENATREQIEDLSGFGPDFHSGTGGLTSVQETRLRSLPNAMISTYTYDPLIGVTSMTDPRGYTMTYHYDEFNRLEFVKDADGKLVSENKYNYKN